MKRSEIPWLHTSVTLIIFFSSYCDCDDNTSPSSLISSNETLSSSSSETAETAPVKCRTPGELVPNTQNCRKYYKCSNGEPSLQSCPGTLIFDPLLKICNWPDSTTCISDLLVKPRRSRPVKPYPGGRGEVEDVLSPDPGSNQLSRDIAAAIRHALTEKPVIVNVTPANKLSKRILSLFQSKDRRGFNKIRANNFNNRDKSNSLKPRVTSFNNRNKDSFSSQTSPLPSSSSSSFETSQKSNEPSRRIEAEPPRVRIRPFQLRTRPEAVTTPKTHNLDDQSDKVTIKNIFRQLPKTSEHDTEKVTENVEAVTEAVAEDVVTRVRSESSVSSVSSRVRVSLADLASMKSDERPFSNGRGGEQFDRNEDVVEEDDYLSRLRQELDLSSFSESASSVATTTSKPKPQPIRCHTGASNELYKHPRNCRKYYKCQNGEPSLQSCPANLIFDTSLRICNWPTASICEEDPEAPLPKHVTSDRAPPPGPPSAINAINIDDYDSEVPSGPSVPHPEHATVPSVWEARQREERLKAEYPQFVKVKETVKTLDTKLVEKVTPGNPDNPDNVKRVEFILSEENYEDLFPRRHPSYTYRRLLQAIAKFPAICAYTEREERSDTVCRKTLATMFAHFTQETGAHNPSDKEFEEWRQGLNVVREQGCTDKSAGCGYNDNCEDKDSITRKWACGKDVTGKWRKYYGRGAKQLSYNFNYGQFSQAMFEDGRLLLDHPDFVADTWLNMASATWFYTTPQPPKPSMLHVIDGTWVPNEQDRANGISPGFGATINIINGGVECNTRDGAESKQARNRIEYYKQFAWYLYVDYQDEELGCAKQKQFSAGGAGALPIYWDKDWASPYSCKLVNYQTAHNALVDGEYIDCVEENFKVSIR